jgi:hypothetical protein
MRSIILPAAAVAAAAMLATTAAAQQVPITKFTVQLSGDEEVQPGDPDGSGTASIRINTRSNQLCYTLRVRGIEPATAAHIHEAPAGSAGPVVVELKAPTGGSSSGCVKMDNAELHEILANPEDYYVNVHNDPYPGGALRGQLG